MTKYKKGDKVLFNGKEAIIRAVKKNFANKQITYRLEPNKPDESGLVANESELKPLGATKPPTEAESVREAYKNAVGREVTISKKNDLKWMRKKIKEAQPDPNDKKREILGKLSEEEIDTLIKEKDLKIETDWTLQDKVEVIELILKATK